MDSHLRYRGYVIYFDGHEYVAEPEEAVSPICEFGDESIDRLIRMIDHLWIALANPKRMPSWYAEWLERGQDGRIHAPAIVKPRRTVFVVKNYKPRVGEFELLRDSNIDLEAHIKNIVPSSEILAGVMGNKLKISTLDLMKYHYLVESHQLVAGSKILPEGSLNRGLSSQFWQN